MSGDIDREQAATHRDVVGRRVIEWRHLRIVIVNHVNKVYESHVQLALMTISISIVSK